MTRRSSDVHCGSMKILLLTRGAPGAGKTTFLEKHGLEKHVISPDQIRCEIGGVYEAGGGVLERGISNERDVWKQVYYRVREKMRKSERIIIDATFQNLRDFKTPLRLSKSYKYATHILDFTSVPERTAQERNAQRTGWQYVPPEVISRAYSRFRNGRPPKSVNVISFLEFENSSILEAMKSC